MTSALNDIKEDLDTASTELWADLRKLVDDATPVVTSALQDARSRSAAVGASLASRIPDQVVDRVPDAISDRLPQKKGRSRVKRLLLVGGVAAVAAGAAVWLRRGSTPASPVGSYPPAPASPNHQGGRPTSLEDEALDLPVNDDRG